MIEEEPVGKHNVQVRRVYDDPADGDGTRVLVDRIWPRGMTKEKAALDEWCKHIAPSTGVSPLEWCNCNRVVALRYW